MLTPITNKYTKAYNALMERARQRAVIESQFEKHHIIPKSLGGSNEANNMVCLTLREHYIAHLLLTKMYDGAAKRKMVFAYNCMTNGFNRLPRYKPTSRAFELRRKALHKEVKPEQRKVSDEEKARRSIARAEAYKATMAGIPAAVITQRKAQKRLKLVLRKIEELRATADHVRSNTNDSQLPPHIAKEFWVNWRANLDAYEKELLELKAVTNDTTPVSRGPSKGWSVLRCTEKI